jgi:heme-degrading monooxygenase HmoA
MIIADLKTPYYAVIFTTVLTNNLADYEKTAIRMEELAKLQDGYLGIESTRNEIGITVSYWKDLASITKWKNNIEHTEARVKGRNKWYQQYQLRICKVERDYGFEEVIGIICCFVLMLASCQKGTSNFNDSQVFRYNEHSNITSLDPGFCKRSA